MSPIEFVALVEKMRTHQRLWFRDKQPGDLKASKILGRSVDKAIKEVKDTRARVLTGTDTGTLAGLRAQAAAVEATVIAKSREIGKIVLANGGKTSPLTDRMASEVEEALDEAERIEQAIAEEQRRSALELIEAIAAFAVTTAQMTTHG